MRRFVIVVMAMGLLGIPAPSRASTFTITNDNCQSNPCGWMPVSTHAVSGDTITWDLHSGAHDVTEYTGDGAGFLSPSGASTYSNVFTGGQWWFRCRLHSHLDTNGVCFGMCGTVSSRTGTPLAPSVSYPSDGANVPGDPVFAGSAQPWMMVTVYRSGSVFWRTMSDGAGNWSVPVSLSPGTLTLSVVASDAESRQSPAVSLTVTVGAGDTSPPSATITSPYDREILLGKPPIVQGVASDDSGVAWVQLWIQSYECPSFDCGYTIKKYTTCPACATGQRNVAWSARALDSPGYYVVAALVRDVAGKQTLSDRVYFMVVDNGIVPYTCPSAGSCTMPVQPPV